MTSDEPEIARLIAARQSAERIVEGMDEGPRKDKAFEMAFARLMGGEVPDVISRKTIAPAPNKMSRKQPTRRNGAEASSRPRRAASPRSRLTALADEGFFDEARGLPDIVTRLRADGHTYKQAELSKPLQRLTQEHVLRRELRDAANRKMKIWYYERHPSYNPE